MKTAIKAVGIFFAALAITCAVAVLVGLVFGQGLAVPVISMSPLVAIGAVVGYVKERRETAGKN